MTTSVSFYTDLLTSVKQRTRQGQARAVLAVNAELIALYWDVGGKELIQRCPEQAVC